jgi:hypothetical protein
LIWRNAKCEANESARAFACTGSGLSGKFDFDDSVLKISASQYCEPAFIA